jgi:hypothetical protein
MSTEAAIKKLKRKVGSDLLAMPSVTGVGICDADEGPALAVYLKKPDENAKRQIKSLVHGVAVRFIESGAFAKR